MPFLTRTDPTRNIDRFYVVDITPTLFGEWAVLREWGRRGSPGTVRLTSYLEQAEAEAVERHTIKRRLHHGYRDPTVYATALSRSRSIATLSRSPTARAALARVSS
jgi:predicted DNA-binding WGR domain protein